MASWDGSSYQNTSCTCAYPQKTTRLTAMTKMTNEVTRVT